MEEKSLLTPKRTKDGFVRENYWSSLELLLFSYKKDISVYGHLFSRQKKGRDIYATV